jgi:sterol desaturase/sphingolipid hydroxylase (fatty acid hydroxylase superfamily)
MAAIMPLSLLSLALFMVHMIGKNAWGHSGHEFRPARRNGNPWVDIVTVNTHHDLHHTAVKGNYGVYFTFWDRLMGTEVPTYHETYRKAIGFQWPEGQGPEDGSGSGAKGDPALATT